MCIIKCTSIREHFLLPPGWDEALISVVCKNGPWKNNTYHDNQDHIIIFERTDMTAAFGTKHIEIGKMPQACNEGRWRMAYSQNEYELSFRLPFRTNNCRIIFKEIKPKCTFYCLWMKESRISASSKYTSSQIDGRCLWRDQLSCIVDHVNKMEEVCYAKA